MNTPAALGAWHPLHPMHAALVFQSGENIRTFDVNNNLFDAAQFQCSVPQEYQISNRVPRKTDDTYAADHQQTTPPSSPPVPGRISSIAGRASAASLGSSDSCNSCSAAGRRAFRIGSFFLGQRLSFPGPPAFARPHSDHLTNSDMQ